MSVIVNTKYDNAVKRDETDTTPILLSFLKSEKVQAFPCGRRRSVEISPVKNSQSNVYQIPFDPEARLNTEANNRKYSSTNGYTQTYLKAFDPTSGKLSIVLVGYIFDIDLADLKNTSDEVELESFINEILTNTEKNLDEPLKIYANIKLERIKLFDSSSDFPAYYTYILRDQSLSDTPVPNLDLLVKSDENGTTYVQDLNNFYFSGLTFSTKPITSYLYPKDFTTIPEDSKKLEGLTTQIRDINKNGMPYQQEISLCLFKKIIGEDGSWNWVINQEALLPQIAHGELENSVSLDTLIAKKIFLKNDNGLQTVPSLVLQQIKNNEYQMQFSSVEERTLKS